MKELKALTGLRAVAALWVLFYHSSFDGLPGLPRPLVTLVDAGYCAVSLFFVLSGFILTYNYLPQGGDTPPRKRIGRYAVARVARIYPVYLLALAAAAITQGPLLVPVNGPLPPFGANLLTALGLQRWVPGLDAPLNFPGWSVSCELFFYLILPLLIVFIRRVPVGRAWSFFLIAAAASTAVAALGAYLCVGRPGLEALFDFFPPLRSLEFIAGAALGYAFTKGRIPARFLRWPDSTVALGAILACVTIFGAFRSPVFLHSGGLAAPFALILIGLSESRGACYRALSTKAMLLLGEASYSIYILQVPVKALMADLWWMGHGDATKAVSYKALTFFLMLATGVLANRFFENPARRWILATYKRRSLATV